MTDHIPDPSTIDPDDAEIAREVAERDAADTGERITVEELIDRGIENSWLEETS